MIQAKKIIGTGFSARFIVGLTFAEATGLFTLMMALFFVWLNFYSEFIYINFYLDVIIINMNLPVKIYSNSYTQKELIRKENINKSGVYR